MVGENGSQGRDGKGEKGEKRVGTMYLTGYDSSLFSVPFYLGGPLIRSSVLYSKYYEH